MPWHLVCLAALGTTITTLVIAAIGTWYGGWVDELIQRITEVNSVLPFLPILIMIGTFYSRSIWLILGATIVLSIFGLGIKNFRAIFLQIKESPYVEAAKAYGASDGRIIIRYLTPRVIPLLIPQLVTLVPSYVFLEASSCRAGSWAIRSCPPGARSSTTRAQTARYTKVCITGFWNPLCCC